MHTFKPLTKTIVATWTQCGLTSESGGWIMSFVRAAQRTLCRTRRHVGLATHNHTQPHKLSASTKKEKTRFWGCWNRERSNVDNIIIMHLEKSVPAAPACCTWSRARPDASLLIHFCSLLQVWKSQRVHTILKVSKLKTVTDMQQRTVQSVE